MVGILFFSFDSLRESKSNQINTLILFWRCWLIHTNTHTHTRARARSLSLSHTHTTARQMPVQIAMMASAGVCNGCEPASGCCVHGLCLLNGSSSSSLRNYCLTLHKSLNQSTNQCTVLPTMRVSTFFCLFRSVKRKDDSCLLAFFNLEVKSAFPRSGTSHWFEELKSTCGENDWANHFSKPIIYSPEKRAASFCPSGKWVSSSSDLN